MDASPARLFVLLARRRPVAAVFRRGPSKLTCLLEWNTQTDQITEGDWFRGRVYTQRCDLSPDGRHLVYFAAKFGGHGPGPDLGYSWTAISRLPSLEPMTAWTKDHCWYGGGLFSDDHTLWVNEPPPDPVPARAGQFALSFNPEAHGEDQPVRAPRETRDGWELIQQATFAEAKGHFTSVQPEIRQKEGAHGERLERVRSRANDLWVHRYSLTTRSGTRWDTDVSWADVDQAGRVVGARAGCLVALRPTRDELHVDTLADLNGLAPG